MSEQTGSTTGKNNAIVDYARYYLGPLCVAVGVAGFVGGGSWVWAGFATYFPLAIFDIVLPRDENERCMNNEWLAVLPLYLHSGLMLGLYAAFGIAGTIGDGISGWSWHQLIGAVASLTWLSAVPNLPIQHELLHRHDRFSRACAFILGALYGDPVRGLAHVHGHHIHLGTPQDCDSAWRGETMYTFPLRATWGSYRDAWRLEKDRLNKQDLRVISFDNRCVTALLFEAALFIGVAIFAGPAVAAVMFVAIAGAKVLVEAFNYYQHYGIVRVPGTAYGRRHLWNHLQPVARALAVEITNHSDHHMDVFRPFYRLKPDVDGPQMPSIFVCFMLGLIPPLWFRLIAWPRLRDWDNHFATPDERELARRANLKAGWPDWFSSGSDINHTTI